MLPVLGVRVVTVEITQPEPRLVGVLLEDEKPAGMLRVADRLGEAEVEAEEGHIRIKPRAEERVATLTNRGSPTALLLSLPGVDRGILIALEQRRADHDDEWLRRPRLRVPAEWPAGVPVRDLGNVTLGPSGRPKGTKEGCALEEG